MPDESKIRQRIELEGEKEYNAALAEARRNLKTLRSELKAETAELGANATAQQKSEVKTRNLQKQIKEQEKVVKTYRDALAEVKKKYGDNDEAVAKWEQKLNEARATLAGMKNSLDQVDTSMKKLDADAQMGTVAAKSFADSIGRIGDIGNSVADSIEGIFTNVVNSVRDTITAIWGDIVDLAARSNSLVDLAGYWNTDVLTLQAYQGALADTANSFEDLSSIVTKINALDPGKIMELTGVSKVNYKDEWQYAMAVMDAMSEMGDRRNEVAFEIFGGRSATKAFDILSDWSVIQENLSNWNPEEGGFGLSEEEIRDMSQLYEQVTGLKAAWESLKSMGAVRLFGNLALDITSNARAILEAFNRYLNAENDAEREQAFQEMEENILALFERIKLAIQNGIALLERFAEDLKNSDDPTLQAIGNVISAFVDALQWLTEDNMQHVVSALEILAGFWIAGKGLKMVSTVAEFIANLNLLKGFHGVGGVGGTGGTTGTGGGGGLLDKLGKKLGEFAASPYGFLLGSAIGTFVLGHEMTEHNRIQEWGGFIENEQAMQGMEAVPEILTRLNEAANGTEEWDPDADRMADAKALFREFGNEFYLLDPDHPIWNMAKDLGYLEDGVLSEEELTALTENAEELGILADDWEAFARDMYNLMFDKYNSGDTNGIPAEWWTNGQGSNGITSSDLNRFQGLPSGMKAAVREGVSGIRVTLDGYAVGQLVAPYVSQQIAREMTV